MTTEVRTLMPQSLVRPPRRGGRGYPERLMPIATVWLARYVSAVNASPSKFWRSQPGLVWSNPNASDLVHIRAALLRPRFSQLLDIAVESGLERVRQEWEVLESERARPVVERILRHVEKGFSQCCHPTRNEFGNS